MAGDFTGTVDETQRAIEVVAVSKTKGRVREKEGPSARVGESSRRRSEVGEGRAQGQSESKVAAGIVCLVFGQDVKRHTFS